MNIKYAFLMIPLVFFGSNAAADDPSISKYLVTDITGGSVSASSIIGLQKTVVQQIETSQDLVAAIQPLTSGDTKAGFGLAITPARTTIVPMSAASYADSKFMRLIGSLTLSYAQNQQDIGGNTYKKTGYSLDTTYYWNGEKDDPVLIAQGAYAACNGEQMEKASDLENKAQADFNAGLIAQRERDQIFTQAAALKAAAYKKCVDDSLTTLKKASWNATRFNLSYGAGSIKAPVGASNSLGRMLTLNAQIKAGDNGALHLSVRRVQQAVDATTLAATPVFKNSSLTALRYTYGSQDDSTLRVLVEASNAKNSSPASLKDTFLAAVGVDKQVSKGIWLEFRFGRNRALEDGKKQTTGLCTLNFAPSAGLFATK